MMDLIPEMLYPTPLLVSPLLPLMLMSLAKDKHTPDVASQVLREYDYVIVGAGSAGSVLGGRLSEMACVSVLLLEAGKSPPRLTEIPAIARSFVDTDLDWSYKTAPQKHTGAAHNNRQIAWPSGKMVGGSSALNAMFAVRGNRKNYDDWAAGGATGWGYKDVLPYFIKMEDNRHPEYAGNGFHGVGGPLTVEPQRYSTSPIRNPLLEAAKMLGHKLVDANGPLQTGINDFQGTSRNGQRCSAAKAYLVPAENRTNLHILPNAFVRKVLIENKRAIGVEFDFKGRTHVVKARKEVILSAGATNSAKLLMLSGIGPKEELQKFNISVLADLPVGYNFQDHQASVVWFTLGSGIKPIFMRLLDQKNVLQYIKSRTGVFGSLEGCSFVANLESGTIDPKTEFPDHAIYFVEFPALIIKAQLNIKTSTFFKYFGPYVAKPIVGCISQILHPKSRGRVYLQSANPFDPPIIDPNFYDHPQDMEDVVQGLKTCLKIGESPAMRKVGAKSFQTIMPGCEAYVGQEDNYLRCIARSLCATTNHQVGTAKMGNPDDATTVVDTELRVKTIEGLRVVDASVMPLVPSANTNVPTMMVAEKAADIIKATVNCERYHKGQEGVSPVNNRRSLKGEPILNHELIAVPSDRFEDHAPISDHGMRSEESSASENEEAIGFSPLNQSEFLDLHGQSNMNSNPPESSGFNLMSILTSIKRNFPFINRINFAGLMSLLTQIKGIFLS